MALSEEPPLLNGIRGMREIHIGAESAQADFLISKANFCSRFHCETCIKNAKTSNRTLEVPLSGELASELGEGDLGGEVLVPGAFLHPVFLITVRFAPEL